MKKLFFPTAVFMNILSGCGSVSDSTLDLSDAESTAVDSTATDCTLYPLAMQVIDNRIVIANGKRDTVCDVFDLPDMKLVATGVIAGSAPDEVPNPFAITMKRFDANSISMLTSISSTLAVIDVPSLNTVDMITYTPPAKWPFMAEITPLGRDSVFAQCPALPMDWAIVDNTGSVVATMPCIVPADIDAAATEEFQKMLLRASIGLASPDHSRFAVCMKSIPAIAIYDNNGRLINTVKADFEYNDGHTWIRYAASCDDAVYANIQSPDDKKIGHTVIAALHWDGTPGKIYRIPKPAGAFCVDRTHGVIYFTTLEDDDNIYSFRL